MGVRVSVYDMSERQRFLSSVCVCVCVGQSIRTCLCIFLLSLNSLVYLFLLCGVLSV